MYRSLNIDRYKKNDTFMLNKVIRNTYILLSITILFSALTSYLSVIYLVKPLNIFFVLVFYFILLYFINKNKNNIFGIIGVFFFTGFLGYTISPYIGHILNKSWGNQIVFFSLFITGLLFFLLSIYALITKKNFEFLSTFLFVGIFIILIAIVFNLFFKIPIIDLMISVFFIILSSGYILYETSNLLHGGETSYVLATVSIYLSVYNIFVSLLQIFGILSNDE